MLAVQGIDEAGLVVRAQQGNREAYAALVRQYHTGVINVIYRLCGDSNLAEDTAQEAFLRAWQHLNRFTPGTSFRNWLYRIAVNAALDVLRRERPAVDIEAVELTSGAEPVEARVERRERADRVRAAVLALPEACRAVLILREYEGLSYLEIADTLDIPQGTVMSRLNYARKLLLGRLSPEMEPV